MDFRTELTQKLGIREHEKKQVVLFFLHNFFIGIGSILIYTSANVILLENHPEFSLPVAYISSAVLMMIVGKIYEHYEHRLQLQTLSSRVLLTACILSGLIIIGTLFDHSIIMAVAIMVGYRVIYLLVNLEFWGLSALLFDVRQSKRLFSIIGAGDMPAKMIGAILAALIHAPSAVPFLIAFSMLMFILALSTQKKTFNVAEINKEETHHHHATSTSFMQLFSRGNMVFRVSVGYALIVTIAIFIEYSFFLNVKHKFHAQHDVTAFIGKILFATYFIGLIIKLAMSQRFLERLGVKTAIFILPALSFGLSTLLVFLLRNESNEHLLLIYFCVYYLAFEVIRRTIFDPVFLILFQPLNSHQRLKGHTLAKGLYEPIGIGITGLALLFLYYFPKFEGWFDFIFVAILAFLSIVAFNAAYRSYLFTLHSAIKKRFIGNDEFGVKQEATKIYGNLLKSENTIEVQTAIEWLKTNKSDILRKNATELLRNKDASIRLSIFKFLIDSNQPLEKDFYRQLLKNEPSADLKLLLAEQIADTEMMSSTDRILMQGAITGGIKQSNGSAQRALKSLLSADFETSNLLGLEILHKTQSTGFEDIISKLINSSNVQVKQKAIALAKPEEALKFIDSNLFWKSVVNALINQGDAGIALVNQKFDTATTQQLERLFKVCEKSKSLQRFGLLARFANDFRTRLKALKTLSTFKVELSNEDFNRLLISELELSRRIFEGMNQSKFSYLTDSLENEINHITDRLFYLLMLNYDKNIVTSAMVGVQHAKKEKRANSFEILENILPKMEYHCLQSILDDSSLESKLKVLNKYLKQSVDNQPFDEYIIEKSDVVFGNWTVSLALLNYTGQNEKLIKPYATHPKKILKESAWRLVKKQNFSEALQTEFTMNHAVYENQISEIERVIILKNTPLFKAIPENVLTVVAPIMQEVKVNQDHVIFKKDDFGDSMYIIYEGEVAIVDKNTELARFGKYEFFGELALLDSEARSASAVAKNDSLLFKIVQDDFYELLEERPELMRNIIKALSQRIRVQNQKMVAK
ncbi:MAG: cyclic nucleotide-binding domain-containing protein [Spirosomataceae bacterium]